MSDCIGSSALSNIFSPPCFQELPYLFRKRIAAFLQQSCQLFRKFLHKLRFLFCDIFHLIRIFFIIDQHSFQRQRFIVLLMMDDEGVTVILKAPADRRVMIERMVDIPIPVFENCMSCILSAH